MRALLQRVTRAKVLVDGDSAGDIGPGLVVFLGVRENDTREQAKILADKIAVLRIFEDEQGKMNRSLLDLGGSILVVSQFTLFADCRKGRRPYFGQAATPQHAEEMYLYFITLLKNRGITVATGRFQAEMQVDLVNHGPVTILIDTDDL